VRLLSDLRRKYGDDLDAVVAHADEAQQRLAELDGHDDRVRELDQQLDRLDEQLSTSVEQIRHGRTSAAGRLAVAVGERLPALGMPHARFLVDVDPAPLGPSGADEVTWRVQANPDAPAVTLGKGASGGERSRVALAVETVLADADQAGTIVFDEVDAGVGGETAMAVGAALAELAHARPDRQVLCVTHLAQVAAFADVHHVVTKDVEEGRTIVRAALVAGDERAEALARMMGSADSEASIAHARELLDAAAQRVQARAAAS
jgi:DNA repair protein RecN (Recombination protein N)